MHDLSRWAKLGVALLAAGAFAPAAHAVHGDPQLILGKLFLVRDSQPGIDPSKRLVRILGRQTAPGDDDHVTACGDPTVDGATIRVIANGGTPTDQIYAMPASGWKRIPANPARDLIGFKYLNPNRTGGPSAVKRALIRRAPNGTFVLMVLLKGQNGPVDNVPPNPGTDGGGILTIGGIGCTYCVNLGGAAGGKVINAPRNPPQNKVFKIVSTRAEPADETTCPVPDFGATTTTSSTSTSTSSTTSTTVAACCEPEQIVTTSTAGTLIVSTLPAFPFPAGVVTTVNVGPAPGFPNCAHPAIVPAGGFSVPTFCIPALGFSSDVIPTGCVTGGTEGKGVVWDLNDACPDADVSKVGDTSAPPCATLGTGCNTAAGGAGADTLGDVDTTRGDGVCDGPGVHVQLDIPGTSITWIDDMALCPDPDGVFDPGTDTLVTVFDFILSPTTSNATAAFVDANGDGCAKAGNGPDGPVTRTGSPTPGPCCVVGQAQQVASVGLAFSGAAPLFDLLFSSEIPNTVTACNPYPGDSFCELPNGCQGSASGAFLDATRLLD
jgi:hypothetical protein